MSVLLDKFLYGRPSYRLVQDLADQGLNLSMGTLTGGLQAIAPLFEPVYEALLDELRAGAHWHADETRWRCSSTSRARRPPLVPGVFQSRAWHTCTRRAGAVPSAVLAEVDGGTISCDRYGAYKKFARLHPGFTFCCWAHQRRDLLMLANDYPQLAPWALAWAECIGGVRADAQRPPGSPAVSTANWTRLRATVQEMADKARRRWPIRRCRPRRPSCSPACAGTGPD
ncbi:MAG: transposase [Sterolibacteriaceae bacterium]|nr:transposase [Sterolibacteriaceae bacterium]